MSSRFFPLIAVGALFAMFLLFIVNKPALFVAELGSRPAGLAVASLAKPSAATSSDLSVLVQASSTATGTQPKKASVAKKKISPPFEGGATSSTQEQVSLVTRAQNLYNFPPKPFEVINVEARDALVNVMCISSRTIRPISGSGVIIDPRGVILTNAHVAQYVLLARSGKVDLSCVIRGGAPARPQWHAEILYIPPIWVHKHFKDILAEKPAGTGEHDYALLRIVENSDGTPIPLNATIPYLLVDTREGVGFLDDLILAASYPAEFIGAGAVSDLYPLSSISTIKRLFTFSSSSVDMVSIGGIAGAQGGSSGGAIVNAWGRLIGIITTTSEGTTTAARDLRAITTSYIDRDITAQTNANLHENLNDDLSLRALEFQREFGLPLVNLYLEYLKIP